MSIAFISACLLSQVIHYETIMELVEVVDTVDSRSNKIAPNVFGTSLFIFVVELFTH